jgi:predicted SprT family Zn-dependent metalloprotease
VNRITDEQFASVWAAAGSLAAAVEGVCALAGERVPRWVVLARAVALRGAGVALPPFPDEIPNPRVAPPAGDALTLVAARELAVSLMRQHGLDGWAFAFNRNVRRAGVCRYPTSRRPGRIELSAHFVVRNPAAEVRDTILHEIAHALVGQSHGHDDVWKAKCREVGARPERTYGEHVAMPKGRWRAECPGCRKGYDRHRRPKRLTGWYCRTCGKDRGALVWRPAG